MDGESGVEECWWKFVDKTDETRRSCFRMSVEQIERLDGNSMKSLDEEAE